jgi:hypothetical protein
LEDINQRDVIHTNKTNDDVIWKTTWPHWSHLTPHASEATQVAPGGYHKLSIFLHLADCSKLDVSTTSQYSKLVLHTSTSHHVFPIHSSS